MVPCLLNFAPPKPQVLDIILIVFGNGKGGLDTPRFLEAMRRKGHFWARRVSQGDG